VLLTCRWSNDTGHRGTFHTFVMKLWNPWYLYHGAKLHHGRGTMVPVCTTVLSPASCTMVPIPATYTMVIWGGTFVPWYMVMVHCTMVTMVLCTMVYRPKLPWCRYHGNHSTMYHHHIPWYKCTAPNYHGAGTMVFFDQGRVDKNWWSVERHFSPLPLRSHALDQTHG
jgi:hypothetical protein